MAASRREGDAVVSTARDPLLESSIAGASLPRDMLGSSVQVPPAPAPGRRKMSWRETVAGKIEEGQYKVRRMELQKADLDREIEALEKVVEGMETEMQYELDLAAHCSDLEMMRRARQLAHPRPPLSEEEERALRDIRDLAVSAVADYAAGVGPEPAYDRPINPFSDTFRLPLPRAMVEVSASRQRLAGQLKSGGNARRRPSGAVVP